ncbi:MAG: 3-deoxy-manno-octulosonate cytidylyltransferase [Flavobacteriaceae bacterium]|nr:3-deoxy-manno-octulosonate cytidylyltransferase [Flavobacteriaceae bacterium]MDG2314229.1 3-deoxy-manno-octulosonate cytidylyltransferase [Flavobacteriaceae bacterium]
MKVIAVIPARLEASRFPGKLLKDLGGKSVIRRTYEAAVSTQLFDQVLVVTDSNRIVEEINSFDGNVVSSSKEHDCGSDRIAEAVQDMEVDIVLNIQGDEPFIDKESLSNLLDVFQKDASQLIDLASLMIPLTQKEDIENPNNVKVIVDRNKFALYFSRSPIPYPRANDISLHYFKHVGIYAFRKQALMDFYNASTTPLEAAEKIECIRHLEYGKRIKMVETARYSIGIDTPDDLEKANAYLMKNS